MSTSTKMKKKWTLNMNLPYQNPCRTQTVSVDIVIEPKQWKLLPFHAFHQDIGVEVVAAIIAKIFVFAIFFGPPIYLSLNSTSQSHCSKLSLVELT